MVLLFFVTVIDFLFWLSSLLFLFVVTLQFSIFIIILLLTLLLFLSYHPYHLSENPFRFYLALKFYYDSAIICNEMIEKTEQLHAI